MVVRGAERRLALRRGLLTAMNNDGLLFNVGAERLAN